MLYKGGKMLEFRLATEVSDEIIFDVWNKGYSDYMIKFKIDMPTFVSRFIENESVREYSYIAYDKGIPVGLILGNIKKYDGIKTMRCGGFAVIPSYRSKGVGKALLEKHLDLATENNCKQLYLEVLKKNERAVKFYENAGYRPVYDYRAYKCEPNVIMTNLTSDISAVGFETIKTIREEIPELHLFWQGEMFTLEHFNNIKNYTISENNEVIAALSLKDNGQINFIWVRQDKRLQGLAKELLCRGLEELEHNKLSAVASNNYVYEGFLRNLGFVLEIEQFEMMLPVKK